MPQLTSNTSTPLGYSISSFAAALSTLISNMRAGKSITAADMMQLVSLYNQFIGHYHSVHDLVGIDTYGVYSVYGGAGTYSDHNTNAMSGSPLAISINPDQLVTASDINTMVAALNSIRSHNHFVLNQYQPAFAIPRSGGWTTGMGPTWYSYAPQHRSSGAFYPTYVCRLTVGSATSAFIRGAVDDALVDVRVNGVSVGVDTGAFNLGNVSQTTAFNIPAGFNEVTIVTWNRGGGRTAGAFQVVNAATSAVLVDVGSWFVAPV